MDYNLSVEEVNILKEALVCLKKRLNSMRINGDDAVDYTDITSMLHTTNNLLDKFKEK